MGTTEIFLIALLIIIFVPFFVWRCFKTDYFAPLVVVQIIAGVLLGPGVLGKAYPEYYNFVFNGAVIQSLNGISWWGVMIFVFLAGIELDLSKAWKLRNESSIVAGLAMGFPLLFGCGIGILLVGRSGWMGTAALDWQFVLGIGMSCSVTALPILVLLLEKLELLRQPIGQRLLRYASLDDIAIWAVLGVVLLDWSRLGRQAIFMIVFAAASVAIRKGIRKSHLENRWYYALTWLILASLAADWCGLHYMVGAFMAGVVLDGRWFEQKQMDYMRHHVLILMMPIFFLSTGLRTDWGVGGWSVFAVAALMVLACVAGKLIGLQIAGRILKWSADEARIIGWLLQTKGLIMIIFSNVLLDKKIITSDTFTALLLMGIVSTMLTIPMVAPRLARNETLVAKMS